MKRNKHTPTYVKIIFSIITSISIFLFTALLGTIIILNTNVTESISPLVSIISSCALSISMSLLLILNTSTKPIYCYFISFIIIIILKCTLTLTAYSTIRFDLNNIISLLFIALFSFIGAVIGANYKK